MRTFLTAFAAVASLLFSPAGLAKEGPASSSEAPLVTTEGGSIIGTRSPSGMTAYLGVPYAAPPLRELRWKAPARPVAWQGVRHADRFAPQCIQPLRSVTSNHYSGAETTSEDCLYLNIWTGSGRAQTPGKAPVIVYIHGGAFFIGAGSNGIYEGEAVSKEGAVFVNFNYRLGPLGFLALPELAAESTHGTSGNYGLLDQIAALGWVKRNIASFGGDPDNVTIVGQSAGSMSVLALQASPLAKGLFHRAIGMSGAMIGGPIQMPSRAMAEQDGTKLMAAWKAQSLAELRALPADRLTVARVPGGPTTGPIVDGYVLPATIPQLFERKEQSDIPLVLGFTRDEALGGLGPVNGLADFQAKAKAHYGDKADLFLKLYRATTDAEARLQGRRADRDGTVAISMWTWAMLQQQNGRAPVYAYEFSRAHSYVAGVTFADLDPATAGAYHTAEVPFWLGTLETFNRFRPTRNWTESDRSLSHIMVRSMVAFAATGKPDTRALQWPVFKAARPRLLELSEKPAANTWPEAERLAFFKTFYSASASPSAPVGK